MKAVIVAKYGSPEGLQIIDTDKPVPEDNEVLVRIQATTVTFGDAMLRRMKSPARLVFGLFMGGLGKGKILGHELSGTIESIGTSVTRFKEGDEVFASAGMQGGAHAEYICIPEESMIATKPSNISFEEAAAVPIGGNTAYDILRKADIEENQKVLIYGASGSVGTYALQLAKHWGAEVTGVSSNVELVKSLGADKVVNYREEDFTESGEKYDVIFDTVRKLSKSKIKDSLKEKAVFLSTSSSTKEKAENLEFLKELIQAGSIKVVVDRRYPLEEIVDAHRYVDSGHKKGNVVVTL